MKTEQIGYGLNSENEERRLLSESGEFVAEKRAVNLLDLSGKHMPYKKLQRFSPEMAAEKSDLFDSLPDDLVISILSKLSSSAGCPSDFVNILMTCKRLNSLALHPLVLSKGYSEMFLIKAKNWSESARRFLELCTDAGNAEAYYALLFQNDERNEFLYMNSFLSLLDPEPEKPTGFLAGYCEGELQSSSTWGMPLTVGAMNSTATGGSHNDPLGMQGETTAAAGSSGGPTTQSSAHNEKF